jgi:hypothetical protein
VNAVAFAERSKVARHEAAHVAAEIYLGHIPSEIEITEPEGGGYVQGWCSGIADHGPAAVMFAVGVLDGHGAMDDEANLVAYAPDPEEREEVLQVAAKIMATPQFAKLQKAFRVKLQHVDRLERDQIARIAAKALGVPTDVLLDSVRGAT